MLPDSITLPYVITDCLGQAAARALCGIRRDQQPHHVRDICHQSIHWPC